MLLLNDHVLKGARVLPGVVTGKLSDFAGLIVAPVLLAVLVHARPRAWRVGAFACVAVPFAMIKLSPVAARAAEELVALIGVPWRIWSDPTDLIALTSLPVAWWLCDAPRRGAGGWSWRVVERAGVVIGAAACLATSAPTPPPSWTTSAYIVDRSGAPQDVRIRWIDADLDCARVAPDPTSVLAREAFTASGVTFSLALDATIPLDRAAAYAAAGLGAPTGPTRGAPCDAALLQIEGMPDAVVFWQTGSPRSVPTTLDRSSPPDSGSVSLYAAGATLVAIGGAGVSVSDATTRPALGPTCDAGTPETYAWSVPPSPVHALLKVNAATVGADGCLAIDLVDPAAVSRRYDVCIPSDLFPFVLGDMLSASIDATQFRLETARASLLVVSGVASAPTELAGATLIDAGCGGTRDACGAYAQHLALELADGTMVEVGRRASLPADSLGHVGVVAVGRAERVIVSHVGCEAPRAALGEAADIVILRTEVAP